MLASELTVVQDKKVGVISVLLVTGTESLRVTQAVFNKGTTAPNTSNNAISLVESYLKEHLPF